MVAIKKIPLSVMTDGPGNETTSDDVDYFVSWIADNCCAETKVENGCASPTDAASSSPAVPGYPRRRSSISTDSKGLDQIVQCLGCHRDDNELWVSPEALFYFIFIFMFDIEKQKKKPPLPFSLTHLRNGRAFIPSCYMIFSIFFFCQFVFPWALLIGQAGTWTHGLFFSSLFLPTTSFIITL